MPGQFSVLTSENQARVNWSFQHSMARERLVIALPVVPHARHLTCQRTEHGRNSMAGCLPHLHLVMLGLKGCNYPHLALSLNLQRIGYPCSSLSSRKAAHLFADVLVCARG